MSTKIISSETFEYLIALCTTNVLFLSPSSQNFRQHDGVGMGSPLRPYHANAFMSQFDGMVADGRTFYYRYMDDNLTSIM